MNKLSVWSCLDLQVSLVPAEEVKLSVRVSEFIHFIIKAVLRPFTRFVYMIINTKGLLHIMYLPEELKKSFFFPFFHGCLKTMAKCPYKH